VAGLGRAGVFHVERIGLRDDCRIVALYDDCAVARQRANGFAPFLHTSWSAFLANDEVELALLATPPALLAELAIEAMSAGKHVLIETPMCLNLAEADAIIAASLRTGRSVNVIQTRRWDDDFLTARQALASGELGRPLAIKYINWHYNPRFARDAAIPSAVAPAEADLPGLAPVHWRDHKSTGGGVLWEFGMPCFDQLLQLAGRLPETVYGRLFPAAADAPADDTFLAIVNFPDGLVAHIEVNRAAPAPLSTGWTIAGDAGSYSGFSQYTVNPDGEIIDVPVPPVSGEADELYTLLTRQLRCGGPKPVPPEAARHALALVEAVRRSARCGQAVDVEC